MKKKANEQWPVVVGVLFIAIVLYTSVVFSQEPNSNSLENHRVLLLGDSQVSGTFGDAMRYELSSRGAVYFAREGETGWGVTQWLAHRNSIRHLIRQHEPTLLLIALGGNDYNRSGRADYPTEVTSFWQFLVAAMSDMHHDSSINWRIIWIAPATAVGPSAGHQFGRDRAAAIIRNIVSDRNYVESRDITGTFGRTPDGLHFTFGGGQDWARQACFRIEACLRQ